MYSIPMWQSIAMDNHALRRMHNMMEEFLEMEVRMNWVRIRAPSRTHTGNPWEYSDSFDTREV
jgi:hypothetical protein